MVLLDVVYLSMNRNRSYASVTLKLMEDTMLEIELHIRYCNPGSIGPLMLLEATSVFPQRGRDDAAHQR